MQVAQKVKKDRPSRERPSNQTNYFMKTVFNLFYSYFS